jgi:hypothetical protein
MQKTQYTGGPASRGQAVGIVKHLIGCDLTTGKIRFTTMTKGGKLFVIRPSKNRGGMEIAIPRS